MLRLRHNANEDVFHREARLPHTSHFDTIRLERFHDPLFLVFGNGNNVQPIAKEGNAPTISLFLQQIARALRLVNDKLEELTLLLRFDVARTALSYELTRDHHSQPVTLL